MRRPRGVAIIVVFLVLILLATVAWAVMAMSSGNLVHSRNTAEGLNALYAAEGGATSKAAVLGNNTANNGPLSGTYPETGATFRAEVYQAGQTYEGFTVPFGHYYIISTGKSRSGVEKKVGVLGVIASSRYDFAAFGSDRVIMADGAKTYSFSSSGAPASHTKATLGTNSQTAGFNILGSTSRVGGDSAVARIYGPPGSVETSAVAAGSAGLNYAAFSAMTQSKPMDDFNFPFPPGTTDITGDATILPGDSFNDVNLTAANTLTLDVSAVPAGGTAEFQFNSLQVLAGSQIVVDPPGADVNCEIYISGPFTMTDGSIVNDSLIPARMKFMIKGGDVELTDYNTKAYYTAYAPENKITVKEGDLYGSVIAEEVEILSAGALYYDVDLQGATGATGRFQAKSHRRF